jgi:hypothetical protein
MRPGKSTVQRKPFGYAITRLLFPSEHKNLQQHRVGNHVDKTARNGIQPVVASPEP